MTGNKSVLILYGGTSSEREVALRSGSAVGTALQSAAYHVELFDYLGTLPADITASTVFPVLHGAGGEDGHVQAQLEALGIKAFVGSDAAASELCFDKWRYKQLLRDNHVKNPEGSIVTADELAEHPLLAAPFVLKPFDGGSSVDTFIIRDTAQADLPAMQAACQKYGSMLLEELIEGVEITLAVLGDEALPVIEIIPPANAEFDYENKYNGATQELCPPQHVSAAVQSQAQALALQIHQLCGCRDLSRTDMIVTPTNELYVLETNTIPGMTNQSLFPKAAATAGIPMATLCDRLVTMAAQRAS